MHRLADPAILYFGTPVVLVSSLGPDGRPNLAPMSSVWWLGRSALLGFAASSQTPQNILGTGECVLNLPSVDEVAHVDRLARTTGADPVPPYKLAMGYRHEPDKFACAGLTPLASLDVAPPRAAECPVQLEAVLEAQHGLEANSAERAGRLVALELRVVRVHLDPRIMVEGREDRIDPRKWRPLMMSFCRFFGLGDEVSPSRLAAIDEALYRAARPPFSRALP